MSIITAGMGLTGMDSLKSRFLPESPSSLLLLTTSIDCTIISSLVCSSLLPIEFSSRFNLVIKIKFAFVAVDEN